MGHGGWEPDSVLIKSGTPRFNWNFQGDDQVYFIWHEMIRSRDINEPGLHVSLVFFL